MIILYFQEHSPDQFEPVEGRSSKVQGTVYAQGISIVSIALKQT